MLLRIDPANVEISNSEMPVAYEEGVEVKVIAGVSMGVQSPFYTRIPMMFLDITLQPRSQTHQTIPESWTAFAYVLDGNEGVFALQENINFETILATALGGCKIR